MRKVWVSSEVKYVPYVLARGSIPPAYKDLVSSEPLRTCCVF